MHNKITIMITKTLTMVMLILFAVIKPNITVLIVISNIPELVLLIMISERNSNNNNIINNDHCEDHYHSTMIILPF